MIFGQTSRLFLPPFPLHLFGNRLDNILGFVGDDCPLPARRALWRLCGARKSTRASLPVGVVFVSRIALYAQKQKPVSGISAKVRF
jgi:hypothetical protein